MQRREFLSLVPAAPIAASSEAIASRSAWHMRYIDESGAVLIEQPVSGSGVEHVSSSVFINGELYNTFDWCVDADEPKVLKLTCRVVVESH